jgi:MoaA/NifB/PqqE/SkfB family radical SAM enzyme
VATFGWTDKARAVRAIVENRLADRPLNVTLELTRRCNARCDYCNHWKEQRQTEQEVRDFVGVLERFQPFSVTLCGGEPFMRRDALDVISAVVNAPGWRYTTIITNGWFLTEARAQALIATGISQINVSLNWPDARQDEDRKLPGLWKRLEHIVPWMVARGARVQLNTVMMDDNLDELLPIAALAERWGASVMYTLYSELPADNHAHLFPPARHARLFEVVAGLAALKRRRPALIGNTSWYFETIPSYVGGAAIPGCTAGKKTLHVSPGGMVRACAELPMVEHWSTYDPRAVAPTPCTRCFQACRGEVQAPITLGRVVEALRS